MESITAQDPEFAQAGCRQHHSGNSRSFAACRQRTLGIGSKMQMTCFLRATKRSAIRAPRKQGACSRALWYSTAPLGLALARRIASDGSLTSMFGKAATRQPLKDMTKQVVYTVI